jgi:hypothetical protein
MPDGIRQRHRKGCARQPRCGCSFEATVYSPRDQRKLRKTFPTLAAARAWRAEALSAVRGGTLRAAPSTTLRAAADELIAGMRSGRIRTRSGDQYKPSVVRSYEQALRLHVLDDLGAVRVCDLRYRDVQALADRLLGVRPRSRHRPKRAPAVARALPAGTSSRGCVRQPVREPRASRRPRPA